METTPLEPGQESIKLYCPHIGLISDGDLLLQAVYEPKEEARKVVLAEGLEPPTH